jgi:hypothetical protein
VLSVLGVRGQGRASELPRRAEVARRIQGRADLFRRDAGVGELLA